MCLAIPAKICELSDDNIATVDILGATRRISLDLTPTATIGDYVLVHAGFAIEVVDEAFAQETIDMIREFPELIEDDIPSSEEADSTGMRGVQDSLAALAEEMQL